MHNELINKSFTIRLSLNTLHSPSKLNLDWSVRMRVLKLPYNFVVLTYIAMYCYYPDFPGEKH